MDRREKIAELKKKRNAIILAHYYTIPEVQEVADYVGDSFALSDTAANTDADVILFAGVHFMAETAKILNPEKIVLIPDLEAGCSLADSCPTEEFAEFVKQHPDHLVISYINTTAEIKALTDIVCTSSNALKIVEQLPTDQKIIFAPDRNLGRYIQQLSGRDNMVIWDGACHVHNEFSAERLAELKEQHPNAKVLAHPECKQVILLMADFIGSTAQMIAFAKEDEAQEFIIVTEVGIMHELQRVAPDKTFIPAPPLDSTCGCSECEFMKLVTLKKIEMALENLEPRIEIEEGLRAKAESSIRRMLTYK